MWKPSAVVLGGLMVVACSKPPAQSEPVSAGASSGEAAAAEAPETGAAATAPPPADQRLSDRVAAEGGDIEIVPLQHATLRLSFAGKHIYVDPWSQAPLSDGPKADLVLVTDIHGDHLDPAAIESVRGPATVVVGPKAVTDKLSGAVTLANGETRELSGVPVEAVPMYNLKRGPSEGALFHDPGRGNGYIVTLGKRRVYVSGDTECTPEMRALEHIDVAFVCMNLPYTMPPEEAAACVKAFQPKVVYPFHYRGSDLGVFETALAGETAVEVRLRDWYVSH